MNTDDKDNNIMPQLFNLTQEQKDRLKKEVKRISGNHKLLNDLVIDKNTKDN